MARAFFSSVLVFLFAVVCAVPTQIDTRQLNPADIINALGVGLVSKIHTIITLESLTTNLVSIDFDVKNPLPVELTIKEISSSAGLNGTVYARFNHTFPAPGLVVPLLGTKNSGRIDNVLLPLGAVASLEIIPVGFLDLLDTDAKIKAATIFGHLGIPLELEGLKQEEVPATYDLSIS
ncbi:hypothetical protein AGABI1DRAFT_110844 [Agaricus bisporus var. burnettii JB137-S8]|uniref:Late embryogenesis abundant protein LEA-2 subgroup domain-containing protein n=1 Tax=Agaricus bisporus var. burnettii (strain JB137-S8 / ATCC MYA-4627 / FGSC 10392) TaxID=597362 RepID=K5XL56_AGABU|nr:uncharacterized protein AGABI1DRAFT_110844 [Agaricus bisporus var. burnettii JB137-S8]EKM84298.1 hypothetical protein AGABI1DRAFT_110844 [Agaricus bisporus var. burnettii JB137-S8]